MLTISKYLDSIISAITMLRSAVSTNGKVGRNSIHKDCENIIRDLLNIVHGYDLTNLNDTKMHFPGLDLGDLEAKVAYQVTSARTGKKIAESLAKIIKYQHFNKFSKIRFFILSEKQKKYSMLTQGKPFAFDPQFDIQDFDDLIKSTTNLSLSKISEIHKYLQAQLPVIQSLNNTELNTGSNDLIIDTIASMRETKLPYFRHFSVDLELFGLSTSVPQLFVAFSEYFGQELKRWFPVVESGYRTTTNYDNIKFHRKVNKADASLGSLGEEAFEMRPHMIRYENARYLDREGFPYSIEEFYTLTRLLFFIEKLFEPDKFNVGVVVNISTNGIIRLHTQQSAISIKNGVGEFAFKQPQVELPLVLTDTKNPSLLKLSERIVQIFMNSEPYFGNDCPYGIVDGFRQGLWFDIMRKQMPDGQSN